MELTNGQSTSLVEKGTVPAASKMTLTREANDNYKLTIPKTTGFAMTNDIEVFCGYKVGSSVWRIVSNKFSVRVKDCSGVVTSSGNSVFTYVPDVTSTGYTTRSGLEYTYADAGCYSGLDACQIVDDCTSKNTIADTTCSFTVNGLDNLKLDISFQFKRSVRYQDEYFVYISSTTDPAQNVCLTNRKV
jgi:hypothetical protein